MNTTESASSFFTALTIVADSIPAIIYAVDIEKRQLVYANGYFKKEFHNIDNKYCFEAIFDNAHPCAFCSIKKLRTLSDGEFLEYEVDNHKTKKSYRLHDSLITLDDGQRIKIHIAFDISKSKQAYADSKNLYAFLRSIADTAPDMLWAKDMKEKYLFANKAICERLLMAKDTKEPIGKTDMFFATRERETHADNPSWHTFGEMCQNSDKPVLENQRAMIFEEYGNINGKLVYLEVHKAPLYSSDGKLLGTVGVGRDITEQKKLEQTLTQLNESLEERISEETNKQLEQERLLMQQSRLSAMGEMIGAIAHQWRQPLNALGLMVQDSVAAYDYGEVTREYLEEMKRNCMEQIQFMSKTIDDFRHFFKNEKEAKPFSLTHAITNTAEMLSAQLNARGISFIQEIHTDGTVVGFENEFVHVLLNLINNAKDALLEKKPNNPMITVSLERTENIYEICVRDNGGGIQEAYIEKVFDPYFTTKDPDKGTGIGLYMSKIIIEQHMRGKLFARNKDDGAEFVIEVACR